MVGSIIVAGAAARNRKKELPSAAIINGKSAEELEYLSAQR